jgi:hypothetical protein
MRRSYISPEYNNTRVYGTFNMIEESNFFGAKMLEIEDQLPIDNQNIIYYQNLVNEQNDISIESTLPSIIYTSSSNKESNHVLSVDMSQSKYQIDRETRWIMDIDLNSIVTNHIFALLKRNRTFEGIKNNSTLENDVNIAMKEYIKKNIINRYKFKSIDLYISYRDLRRVNGLRYKNIWTSNVAIASNKLTKLQSEGNFDYSKLKVIFNQQKEGSNYAFDYFFNILFEKI